MQNRKNNSTSAITIEHHLNDDLKFLINCCKTNPDQEDIKQINNYIQHSAFDIQNLLALSSQHGVLPLVYKTIKNLQPVILSSTGDPQSQSDSSLNTVRSGNALGVQHLTLLELNSDTPVAKAQVGCNAFLSKLKTQYMIIAQRNMLMSAELIRIIQLLEKNSIEALAFKGPTLSQMAYGDITLRQYADLDVLVKKEDIYKIDTLLKSRGYQRVLKLSPVQEKVYIQNAQDLGFYHPKSGLHFEMHWSLLNEDYPMQINLDTIWKNPQTVKINQQEIKTFPIQELLTYLCIHGSKHLWERIEWIKDIDLLIRKEDIDWEKIVKKVDGSGFEVMIYLGLSLAMRLFETPLPKYITDHISDMKILNTLSDFVLQSWQSPKNTFQQTHAKLKLFPGIKEQAIYLHKILIKPSLNDYWFIDLPKPLYWVYYFIHPYLLIKKYLTKQNIHTD